VATFFEGRDWLDTKRGVRYSGRRNGLRDSFFAKQGGNGAILKFANFFGIFNS
jgi:hypothetical protein